MKIFFVFLLCILPQGITAQICKSRSHYPYEEYVARYATYYHISPEFVSALIDVESDWNPHAVSSQGAMGLGQLMPATAKRFGAFKPFDPEQNVAAATRYITALMWQFRGDLRLVAAAYNSGEQWVSKKHLDYRNPEVVEYVRQVRRCYATRIRRSHAIKPTIHRVGGSQ